MKIKKGRPSAPPEKAVDILEKKEDAKAAYNPNDTIAFKNKIFINKEGMHCTVTYSECKDEPIIIRAK